MSEETEKVCKSKYSSTNQPFRNVIISMLNWGQNKKQSPIIPCFVSPKAERDKVKIKKNSCTNQSFRNDILLMLNQPPSIKNRLVILSFGLIKLEKSVQKEASVLSCHSGTVLYLCSTRSQVTTWNKCAKTYSGPNLSFWNGVLLMLNWVPNKKMDYCHYMSLSNITF